MWGDSIDKECYQVISEKNQHLDELRFIVYTVKYVDCKREQVSTKYYSLRYFSQTYFSSLNLIELTPSCMIMIVSLTTSILLCWRHEVWGCYHQQVYKRFDKIISFFMSSSFCWIFAWFTLVSKKCSKYILTKLWYYKALTK